MPLLLRAGKGYIQASPRYLPNWQVSVARNSLFFTSTMVTKGDVHVLYVVSHSLLTPVSDICTHENSQPHYECMFEQLWLICEPPLIATGSRVSKVIFSE